MDTDNKMSRERTVCRVFTDGAAPFAYEIKDGGKVEFRIYLSEPFDAFSVGLPTWGRTNCSLRARLFSARDGGTALFTKRIEHISDCEQRTLHLPAPLDAGEYLLVLDEPDNVPGVWVYPDVCGDSALYLDGKLCEGVLQASFSFIRTPVNPFEKVEPRLYTRVTEAEKRRAELRFERTVSDPASFPVSVAVDGVKHNGFDGTFTLIKREEKEEHNPEKRTVTLTFKHKSGLKFVIYAAHYREYAAYEWRGEIINDTDKPSPVISDWNIKTPDMPAYNPVLKGILGDGGLHGDPYAPYEVALKDAELSYTSPSGRTTYNRFPYFNVMGENAGFFFILGWPGKWRANFAERDNKTVCAAAQDGLFARIPAGEKFISPLVLILEYRGKDEFRAANLWRRFFIECNMKKPGGELFSPHLASCTSLLYGEMKDATDENQIKAIDAYVKNGVPIDFHWMDAGWYYKTGEESLDVWLPVGTWVVDRKRFPSGLRAVSDHAHALNIKTLLWFEPEICRLPLSEFGPTTIKKEWLIPNSTTRLVDIGNAEFRDFMLDRVFNIIDEGGIDLYRQDYGIAYPSAEMHGADPDGQSGYVENRYYQGYYDYLDRIAARYPDMMIDSCAAGGGRNDITTMRRAVPLHKTDLAYSDYTIKTAMHQGLFAWLPYFGTPLAGSAELSSHPDTFIMRCNYCPFINIGADTEHPESVDWDTLRRGCEEWKRINKYFYADYYPLIKWNNSEKEWRGWEFFDSENGEGFIELIRDAKSPDSEKTVVLKGLNPSQKYRLVSLDGEDDTVLAGRELMGRGLRIKLPEPRSVTIRLISEEK